MLLKYCQIKKKPPWDISNVAMAVLVSWIEIRIKFLIPAVFNEYSILYTIQQIASVRPAVLLKA